MQTLPRKEKGKQEGRAGGRGREKGKHGRL